MAKRLEPPLMEPLSDDEFEELDDLLLSDYLSEECKDTVTLGACPRTESLLRESPFGPFFRSFSSNMNNYSPQMIEKMDSK